MAWSFASLAVYVLLIGIGSFIEVSVGRGLSAFQLNLLIRAGSLLAAILALIAIPHALGLPSAQAVLAGLGVGLCTGIGSIFYCIALGNMRVSLVVTLSNLYLVVTALLGLTLLREPFTELKLLGFASTLVGVVMLSHVPARYGVNSESGLHEGSERLRAFAAMGAYIAFVGVGAFLEKPVLSALSAAQLNALMGVSMVAVAGVALGADSARLPTRSRSLPALGIGFMIGVGSVFYFLGLRGLPVSVAAAASNAYIVITVLLSATVGHQQLTRAKIAAIGLTIVGVALLSLSTA